MSTALNHRGVGRFRFGWRPVRVVECLLIGLTFVHQGWAEAAERRLQPKSVIPENQLPLLRVIPLENDDMPPAGRESIVVFGREKTGSPEVWDFIATAWEIVPSRTERPFAKRIEFAHSSWSAELLWDELPNKADEFVRLQIDGDRPGNYSVNLYRINYRDWQVDVLEQLPQAMGLGATREVIYVHTDRDIRLLRRDTGHLQPLQDRFELVKNLGNAWLARRTTDSPDELSVFDPDTQTFSPTLHLPSTELERAKSMRLSPDKRHLIYVLSPDVAEEDFPKACQTKVVALDIPTRNRREHAVSVYVTEGSGVRFLLPYFECHIPSPGTLRVTTGLPEDRSRGSNINYTESRINLLTGERSDRPSTPPAPRDRFAGMYVPASLGAIAEVTDAQQDLAFAFIEKHGIESRRSHVWDRSSVAYSDDRKRFVLKTHGGKLHDRFFVGDLENDTLLTLKSPPELESDNALSLNWVKTP